LARGIGAQVTAKPASFAAAGELAIWFFVACGDHRFGDVTTVGGLLISRQDSARAARATYAWPSAPAQDLYAMSFEKSFDTFRQFPSLIM